MVRLWNNVGKKPEEILSYQLLRILGAADHNGRAYKLYNKIVSGNQGSCRKIKFIISKQGN